MKVLFGLRVSPELRKHYKESLPGNIELIFPREMNEESLLEFAPEIDIFVAYRLFSRFLEKATKLKHIQVPWTGSETLDLDLIKQYPHLTVSNSHSNSLAIAEHAVSLLLAAAKRITYRDSWMRKGDWSPRYNEVDSYWLTGKTLGVIGYGAIGKKVAEILKKGFQMRVYAIKRDLKRNDNKYLPEFLGEPKDLTYVLKESDFILISLPLTTETKGIIGKAEFEVLKKSAIIVNISRGPVIDEKALFDHLKSNSDALVASDVWYNYPKDRKNPTNVFQNYPFEELDNIILSPHSSFKVHERETIFTEDIITNIFLLSEGGTPINQLNLDLGY